MENCSSHMRMSFSLSPDSSYHSPIRRRSKSPIGNNRKGEFVILPKERFGFQSPSKYNDIAERNGNALVREEEEAKLKALRKKAKKERQKQKKIQAKLSNSFVAPEDIETNPTNISNSVDSSTLDYDSEEINDIDEKSAFYTNVMKKVKQHGVVNNTYKSKNIHKQNGMDSLDKEALECENAKYNKEAICNLSEEINSTPNKINLLLDRSLVHFNLGNYKQSIQDAERSLSISPFNPEAYYRLGEANFALNNYSEADAAFSKLIDDSSFRDKVKAKLFSLRSSQLKEMGYTADEAYSALITSKNETLSEAVEYITSLQNGTTSDTDIYYSEEDEEDTSSENDEDEEEILEDEVEEIENGGQNIENSKEAEIPQIFNYSMSNIVIKNKSILLFDPTNPFKCRTLFVSHMKDDVTCQEIYNVFVKFGDITRIKLSIDPTVYAFVNFVEWESAGLAMEAMQGSRWLLSTTKALRVKYPVKIVNELLPYLKNPQIVLDKLKAEKEENIAKRKPFFAHFKRHSARPFPSKPDSVEAVLKPSQIKNASGPVPFQQRSGKVVSKLPPFKQGPVETFLESGLVKSALQATKSMPRPPRKTVECYYWCTTGCFFGNNCFNLHLPEHKGIALKNKFQE